MIVKPLIPAAALLLIGSAAFAPVLAQDRQGRLGTLPHGTYICSLPGDASGPAWIELPGQNFIIDNASTYHTQVGSGTYLLTGKRVTFTGGPMKGIRFERTGKTKLRRVNQNGTLSRIRCIRGAAQAERKVRI